MTFTKTIVWRGHRVNGRPFNIPCPGEPGGDSVIIQVRHLDTSTARTNRLYRYHRFGMKPHGAIETTLPRSLTPPNKRA